MSEAIKTFQALDSNSIISLIILKGNLSYILKKFMFMFIKYLVTNVAWGNCPEGNCLGGNCPGAVILCGNCPGRNVQGAIVLDGNCPGGGGNFPGGNCPVPKPRTKPAENERLLQATKFTAKYDMVFVSTQENASS